MEFIKKAGELGGTISTWTKIIIGLLFFVGGGFLIYNQIQHNTATNTRQDTQFIKVLETMDREFEVWGQRSDKRYKRASEEAIKLENKDQDQDKQLLDLHKKLSYLEGYLKGKSEN